ncbi:MAG: hypothetical protein J6F30_04690 [Cellulosilyticum sp.]|nr:hypothetical protein [Cellulosilyticum sp.]
MRWVTFHYNALTNKVSVLKVHENKESALKYFNITMRNFFEINTNFKADKLPATYGYPLRKYCGISARAFKKEFGISVDEVLKIAQAESEKKNK